MLSLVDIVLQSLEARLLLVAKGAKEYYYMCTIQAITKTKLWPEQANINKQQVVDRLLTFAQTLFQHHSRSFNLGEPSVGSGFGTDQVSRRSRRRCSRVMSIKWPSFLLTARLGCRIGPDPTLGGSVGHRFGRGCARDRVQHHGRLSDSLVLQI